ncbi:MULTISPECIES: TraV family lipoprotein [Sphingobium]|jgi:conjugal transfer pilus assembly protein TraV|uniref:TraV family lipoprotein n=1 Tax=Sphingobium TaxID=165695 RepID=UPI0004758730|nr:MULTISPECIES: TraV family lipoprotein [Sphingobium]HUD93263.1 TraV family lipoprotein [Sphingobium sp.]
MQSRHRRQRLCLTAGLGFTSLLALSSCASFGGNVRGSFSCAAPDGICAPSSTIDDRALALISADPSDGDAMPTGNIRQPMRGRTNRAQVGHPARLASADAGRTQEKVLRIVFQPYIDERGRLHEASAVHAVVARGEWQQQALTEVAVPPRRSAAAQGLTESLADAVDRVDPPLDSFALSDPDAPGPAAVAAARARKPDAVPDPVSAIKADVRARLAPKAQAASRPGTAAALSHTPSAAASPVLQPPSGASTGGSPQAKASPTPAPVPASGTGAAAVAHVKADPRYQEVATGAAKGARDAAAAQSGVQAAPAAIAPTVKAANFPAAVQEDK